MINHNDDVSDEENVSRWIPAVVVICALIGFFWLAWYAYQSGTQSINEGDLVVIEADNSPLKEKPLDPGGMKFPNQDKTIFETFAGNGKLPAKVERVLPPPEEPVARSSDNSTTKTWINKKLRKPAEGTAKEEAVKAGEKIETLIKEEVPKVAKPAVKKPVVKVALKPTKPKAKPRKVAAKKSSSKTKIQLGAYGSQAEAKRAWKKISKKFAELADKPVYVVKADLGAKGVFYRLRASGVGGLDEARAFCAALSKKGQPCLALP